MKTKRITQKVERFLLERPRSTTEIKEHLNSTTKDGTTSQQLSNVLSKNKNIVNLGRVARSGNVCNIYNVCQWALAEDYMPA